MYIDFCLKPVSHFRSLYISSPIFVRLLFQGDGRTHHVVCDVLTSGLRSLLDRHLVSTFQICYKASWSTNEGRLSNQKAVYSSDGWQTTGLVTMVNAQWNCNAVKRDQFHSKAFVTGYVTVGYQTTLMRSIHRTWLPCMLTMLYKPSTTYRIVIWHF
jgi:hypothetical protein